MRKQTAFDLAMLEITDLRKKLTSKNEIIKKEENRYLDLHAKYITLKSKNKTLLSKRLDFFHDKLEEISSILQEKRSF